MQKVPFEDGGWGSNAWEFPPSNPAFLLENVPYPNPGILMDLTTKARKCDSPHFYDKNLSDLPDEVMLKILTYLNFKDLARCAKVSKRLRKVCKDKSLCGELAPYSAAMKRLCKDIEANVYQFKSKPIGPLGRHIKLTTEAAKNDQLRSLLEISLGQYRLKSFLVECKQDQIGR